MDQEKISKIRSIYESYIREVNDVRDISRWVTKRTITKSVLNPERTNEQKLYDAIAGKNFKEGDKVWVYFDENDKLKLQDEWDGDENVKRLMKRVFDTIRIFKELLDMEELLNYTLKRNENNLKELLK